ncbi:MAG TPA: DUF4446 family protein [Candidatus Limnocylindria bacterium]|nr:DUF4446 family protein [Candidatus Limnocylindria bacterium]
MFQDPRTVELALIALLVAVVALAVSVALVYRSQAMLRRRLRRLLTDGEGMGLDAIAADLEKVDRLGERVDALNELQRDLERTGQRAVQRVGVVRFNPFTDTGGDQSFAIALLDALGNGLVVSSLHGRADTRVFAKQVRGGRSKHQLSTEEEEAIRQALAPTEA